jgi:hypothetical protein
MPLSRLLKEIRLFNYKCPNGLPPEECLHAPQLIINVINYFQKKRLLAQDDTVEVNQKSIHQQQSNQAPSTERVRRRG